MRPDRQRPLLPGEARGRTIPRGGIRSRLRSVGSVPFGALALSFALAACTTGNAVSVPPGPDATGSIVPITTATPEVTIPASPATAPTSAYPMTLADDEGGSVTLATEPRRIVSLTPATTEVAFALGAGDRVVAKVEDITPYPPEADGLPVVAKFGSVDVERIVGLDADLVIAGGNGFNPIESIAQLRRVGIPVLVLYARDVAGVLADIELVGTAIGEPAASRALTASMRSSIDVISTATARLPHPRTFYELDAMKEIYGPAKGSAYEEMITLAGGTPITSSDPAVYSISLERLVAADPEVIVLGDGAYGVTAKDVAARPGWGTISAVTTGAIRPVDDVIVTRPGPRLAEGLRALALAIHPDASLPASQ